MQKMSDICRQKTGCIHYGVLLSGTGAVWSIDLDLGGKTPLGGAECQCCKLD